MNELALFAGAGGGILGGKLLGWRTVCAVETDPYCASVLAARQNDGTLPPFPIWDDVRTFRGAPWQGVVDVVSGGFPCQDISAAGRGEGINGARSGLWREMARIVGEVRPRYVLVENSPVLTSRGLGLVLGDLAEMGYDARWGVLGAADAIWDNGDPVGYHRRNRIWIATMAYSNGGRKPQPERRECQEWRRAIDGGKDVANAICIGQSPTSHREIHNSTQAHREANIARGSGEVADTYGLNGRTGTGGQEGPEADHPSWWKSEPDVGRVAHGVAHRVDRLKALGNGQVPACVRLAWECLSKME